MTSRSNRESNEDGHYKKDYSRIEHCFIPLNRLLGNAARWFNMNAAFDMTLFSKSAVALQTNRVEGTSGDSIFSRNSNPYRGTYRV